MRRKSKILKIKTNCGKWLCTSSQMCIIDVVNIFYVQKWNFSKEIKYKKKD